MTSSAPVQDNVFGSSPHTSLSRAPQMSNVPPGPRRLVLCTSIGRRAGSLSPTSHQGDGSLGGGRVARPHFGLGSEGSVAGGTPLPAACAMRANLRVCPHPAGRRLSRPELAPTASRTGGSLGRHDPQPPTCGSR